MNPAPLIQSIFLGALLTGFVTPVSAQPGRGQPPWGPQGAFQDRGGFGAQNRLRVQRQLQGPGNFRGPWRFQAPERFRNQGGRPAQERPAMPLLGSLSPEQRQSLREMLPDIQARTREVGDRLREARQGLHRVAWEERLNEDAIHEHAREVARLEAELVLIHRRALENIRPRLSPEQKEQFRELRGAWGDRIRERLRVGGPRPGAEQGLPQARRERARGMDPVRQEARERAEVREREQVAREERERAEMRERERAEVREREQVAREERERAEMREREAREIRERQLLREREAQEERERRQLRAREERAREPGRPEAAPAPRPPLRDEARPRARQEEGSPESRRRAPTPPRREDRPREEGNRDNGSL